MSNSQPSITGGFEINKRWFRVKVKGFLSMTLYVICLGELTNHKMQVIFHLVYCLLAEKYLAKITWLVFVLLHYFPLMNASQLGKFMVIFISILICISITIVETVEDCCMLCVAQFNKNMLCKLALTDKRWFQFAKRDKTPNEKPVVFLMNTSFMNEYFGWIYLRKVKYAHYSDFVFIEHG